MFPGSILYNMVITIEIGFIVQVTLSGVKTVSTIRGNIRKMDHTIFPNYKALWAGIMRVLMVNQVLCAMR